jgi:aryl-alcohol dehydrogenase-like predicted oxidoreductase
MLQLHAFDASTPVEEVRLDARRRLVRAGKLRYIGVSNFSGWQMMKSLALSRPARLGALCRATRSITRWSAATTSGS